MKKIEMVHETGVTLSSRCATNNGGCSHVCLLGANGPYCACPAGFLMSNDSKTCTKKVESCHEGEWRCVDGSECLLEEWRCDGHSDCKDRLAHYVGQLLQ